ncbi:MAG: outer membrane protein assembly factor BamA [Gemmatimonadales bacterium]|nr:outer membrane protein assembly factor BamA [Gemmatimonadales bacterium]
MVRALLVLLFAGALSIPAAAQENGLPLPPPVDSIAVEGNSRIASSLITAMSGITVRSVSTYRDIQRAITNIYRSGQFDDVRIEQRDDEGRLVLVIIVAERPMLRAWSVRGASKISPRDVRDRVTLRAGRPLDRAAMARSRYQIDSMYRDEGYYAARVMAMIDSTADGGVDVVFDIAEGSRIAIARVDVSGNTRFPDSDLVGAIASKPQGFWWFRPGEYDEDKVERDVRDRLPGWYADRGYVDFQVLRDTLLTDDDRGKAVLDLTVEEGPQYMVGSFEIVGNRRFSLEQLAGDHFPFATAGKANTGQVIGVPFNRSEWAAATEGVSNQYLNNGYIYANIEAEEARRTMADGSHVLDLRWRIVEGQPATINKILILGNDVTHERVIREAIVVLPGELFNRDRLIRSYQNVNNLGFFEQPMPFFDVKPNEAGDVDLTLTVTEKRTGNINFGASVGQGTGLGGFLGLEEPNLFGRGKRGRLQWQFGRNINDFTLSYTDPAINESRISGTVSVYNSRQRFVIGDLGRRQQEGGSLQLGLPLLGSRYTRVFASYGFQRIRYTEGSADIQAQFQCAPCSRSTLGLSVLRDVRVGLPFPVAGSFASVGVEQNGGPLGGTGDYQKVDLDTRWYAPIGVAGGGGQVGSGIQFTLGLTAKSGFIFGNPGGFFTELYSLGGVQYGIPLRGYDEFSITPNGYDAFAGSSRASAGAFGKAYAAFTVEAGARLSQSLYVSTFFDAGNVYRTVRQYDPTRLFRGAGVGAALISPLGPIGVDVGYGFDKIDAFGRPAPGWQVHFRLGNFF